MKSETFNIYIIGVGGQGLGLLSETIARAAAYSGINVCGTDTHGLAQRGGMVDSTIRLGENVFSPLIRKNDADLVIGMEINESLRGVNDYLKPKGTLVYYSVSWQPLPVRLGKEKEVKKSMLEESCKTKEAKIFEANMDNLKDSRMQNVVLLGVLAKNQLIPGIEPKHYKQALSDLLNHKILESNIEVFEKIVG
ncbi:MAG: 2-oxoacid:acceptor oxidoreductase family protein [Bacteroidales bacterium]|nr:2-oxoacid:acceptor oxidoreductase family protein [Bacteroidales bacterium]